MTNFEAAEFFEEEMNPNLYAGARMVAEQMLIIEGVPDGGRSDAGTVPRNTPSEVRKELPA